ncbi:hypothetical protein LTR64_004323 [Lithohypha guttulata]|uniref:uncharacterized protein n=1 Tax=Lithohypha guttulata TaxID=1690604 RepID=UPI002DDE2AA6|nr:hypothetical protein LTR51_006382 [Lithohypha guttulata]
MSSIYSSRRGKLAGVVLHESSKSAPQTPAKQRYEPIYRTVPDSPKHNRLLSDDDGLDVEILTHKLQLYQLELEEADLRRKHKRMQNKEAEDIAAAARFLNTYKSEEDDQETSDTSAHSRSRSMFTTRTSSLPGYNAAKFVRAKRPDPLRLAPAWSVQPQQVQSAGLVGQRNREVNAADEMKRHWRRTTLSAGHNAGSKIILISSPGMVAEYDFAADVPPVPQLSTSISAATTPLVMSPITPLPLANEDQVRRELESFALQEGPNLALSRRSSVVSRKRMPVVFVPSMDDRVCPDELERPETPTALMEHSINSEPNVASHPSLTRTKSLFSRFERKNDVDALLDLYMTEEQLVKEKTIKKNSIKSRPQNFFKRFQSKENVTQRSGKPR